MTEITTSSARDSAAQPSLEFLRKQAKALLKALESGDAEALRRLREQHPSPPPTLKLADAQFVVACEQGFSSWPKLTAYIDSISGAKTIRFRTIESDPKWYDDRADGLLSQHQSGLPLAARQIQRSHPRFRDKSEDEILAAEFTLYDARLVTAREHGRPDWRALERWVRELASGETVEPFYQAFQAIKANDLAAIEDWLRRDPSLASAHGSNGNTLLNLAVGFRNSDVIRLLIRQGADVNAPNVRGWTPLHAAAYGNNAELVELFLAHAADPILFALGDGGTPLVMALFWGNVAAADLLAERCVMPMNLRAAAGVGRVDLVESLFSADGALRPEAGAQRGFYRPHSGFPVWHPSDDPQEILDEAFVYAAKSGRIGVLDLLLKQGARINADPYRGSALHWAACKPALESVARWLIDHGADPSLRATFGGPQHGQGVTPLHLAAQNGYAEMVKLLIHAGSDRTIRDDIYQSNPASWADHFGHNGVAEFLRDAMV